MNSSTSVDQSPDYALVIADEIEAHLVREIHMLRKVYVHYHPLRRSEKRKDPE